MTAPLTASAPPTRNATRARGTRIFQNIDTDIGAIDSGSGLPKSLFKVIEIESGSAIDTLPIFIHRSNINMQIMNDNKYFFIK